MTTGVIREEIIQTIETIDYRDNHGILFSSF